MRVLGRIRLSRATEESTSVERQREIIESWASQNGHEVVGWAEDLDVSGSVDPFKTPALGQWLTEHKSSEWDILAAWKLDRLGRDSIRLNKLFGWCIEHRKTLVSTSEGIDLSTPVGRLIANVIAFLAEGEREAIVERTTASQKKLRELGRWGGGTVFYGYKAVEHPTAAGWVWERDEVSSAVLLDIIDQVLEKGRSTEQVAWELNKQKVLAPSDHNRQRSGKPAKGIKWHNATIRTLLANRAMLGHILHSGVTVRDGEGNPVQLGPPLVTQETFDRLQTALETRTFKVTRTRNASPMLGVAHCALCGRLMHYRQHDYRDRKGVKNGVVYRYYQCVGGKQSTGQPDHQANVVKAHMLEESVYEAFLDAHGGEQIEEPVFVPAEDHTIELDEAVRAVEEITPLLGTVTSATMRSRLLEQLTALDSKIAQLEQLPKTEAHWTTRKLDKTYADVWEDSDAEAKRQLLLKRQVTARVDANGMKVSLSTPDVLP